MGKRHESIRIFKSSFLEKFTHVHPLTPLILWTPVIAWLLWRSREVHGLSFLAIGLLGFLGLFIWSFTEYTLHRYIFHLKPKNHFQSRLQFIIHGLHHDDPIDPTRLVMPPLAGIGIAIVLFTFFRLIFGGVWVEPFFAFFLVGYLCYDYIHFSVHHFTPRTVFGKYLRQSHMIHHFVNSHSRWGVSSPLWDIVFGTYEPLKKEQPEQGSV